MTGGCIVNREAKYRPARGQGWLDTCGYPDLHHNAVWGLGTKSWEPTVRIGTDCVHEHCRVDNLKPMRFLSVDKH